MIKDKMPGKEENWLYENWGKDIIENAKKQDQYTVIDMKASITAQISILKSYQLKIKLVEKPHM